MRYPFLAAVIVAFAAAAAHADERAARDCVAIVSDAARLACYDAALKRATAAAPAGAAAASGVPTSSAASGQPRDAAASKTTEAAAATGTSSFGIERVPKKSDEPEQPTKVKATIVGVSMQARTGRVTVTLDNGQVWEQLGSVSELHQPRTGDPVSIRKASFGSYLMYNEKRGSSRVRRVQ